MGIGTGVGAEIEVPEEIATYTMEQEVLDYIVGDGATHFSEEHIDMMYNILSAIPITESGIMFDFTNAGDVGDQLRTDDLFANANISVLSPEFKTKGMSFISKWAPRFNLNLATGLTMPGTGSDSSTLGVHSIGDAEYYNNTYSHTFTNSLREEVIALGEQLGNLPGIDSVSYTHLTLPTTPYV